MENQTLKKDPFPCTGLDNYFFTTPALKLRLDLVNEHIRENKSPVLILGESGVGKSTLLNRLVCRADHNWRVVRVPAVRSFSAKEIIAFLIAELHLPSSQTEEAMLTELSGWVERLAVRGQIAVIVIDNAHDLRDEALMRLANLHRELRSKSACIVMTGLPELRSRLNALLGSNGSKSPLNTVNIPCLDRREVASYIDMRLYHAGLEGRGPFTRATIDEIARSSRGYPGQINVIANDLLSGEQKRLQWQRASQRVRRIMRNWLTVTLVTTGVAISSVVAPASIRVAGGGSAVAHASTPVVATRHPRIENVRSVRSLSGMAARVLVALRGLIPRTWSIGR